MQLLTFTFNEEKTIFEPLRELPDNFIEAKDGCNSDYFKAKGAPKMCLHKSMCRKATSEEEIEYNKLKSATAVNPQHN